jgi:hypothetical protein
MMTVGQTGQYEAQLYVLGHIKSCQMIFNVMRPQIECNKHIAGLGFG